MSTPVADHRIRLDAFEGPLDLLLYLIRKEEIEVTDIPIASIADQYLAALERAGLEHIDIDTAGEFLVMAATLMEIKSRMLAPRPAGQPTADPLAAPAEAEDPRAELVRQLLEYKRFRDAAQALEVRKLDWDRRYPAAKAGTDNAALRQAMLDAAGELELDDISLIDLAQAFAQLAATVNFERLGEHEVKYDDTPIELHAEDILDRLRRAAPEHSGEEAHGTSLSLHELFAGRSRGEMLGLFLATLELVKRSAVRITQSAPGAEIRLALRADRDAATDGVNPAATGS